MRRKNTMEVTKIYWNVLLWIFSNDVLINFFITLRRSIINMGKFRPTKAGSGHYKRGIPPCLDETFYIKSQDIIYEEFITLLGSGKTGQIFIPANRDHVLTIFADEKLFQWQTRCFDNNLISYCNHKGFPYDSHISRIMNLLTSIWVGVGGWVGGSFTPCWFSLNNSETVTLVLYSIQ